MPGSLFKYLQMKNFRRLESSKLLWTVLLSGLLLATIHMAHTPQFPYDTRAFGNRLYALRYTLIFPVWILVSIIYAFRNKQPNTLSNYIHILSLLIAVPYCHIIAELLFPAGGWTSYPPLAALSAPEPVQPFRPVILNDIMPLLLIVHGFIFCFRWGRQSMLHKRDSRSKALQ